VKEEPDHTFNPGEGKVDAHTPEPTTRWKHRGSRHRAAKLPSRQVTVAAAPGSHAAPGPFAAPQTEGEQMPTIGDVLTFSLLRALRSGGRHKRNPRRVPNSRGTTRCDDGRVLYYGAEGSCNRAIGNGSAQKAVSVVRPAWDPEMAAEFVEGGAALSGPLAGETKRASVSPRRLRSGPDPIAPVCYAREKKHSCSAIHRRVGPSCQPVSTVARDERDAADHNGPTCRH
jgi:hypothetical protein